MEDYWRSPFESFLALRFFGGDLYPAPDSSDDDKNILPDIERSCGAFVRSLRLSSPVREDDVEATFTNGALKLTLPKSGEGGAQKSAIG